MVRKLDVEEVLKLGFATASGPQEAWLYVRRLGVGATYKHRRFPRILVIGWRIQDWRDPLLERIQICLIPAQNRDVQGTIGITRRIPALMLLFSHTGASLKIISKSILPPLWQNWVQHSNIAFLQTANNNMPELEEIMLLHARMADLEERLCYGSVIEPAVQSSLEISIINGVVPASFNQRETLRNFCRHNIIWIEGEN